jgi:hypothetical protein
MAGTKVTRIYSGFRGVDFRGEEINLVRSPDALNMWKDYKDTESIKTRPGLKLFTDIGPEFANDHVYGIFVFETSKHQYMMIHVADMLLRYDMQVEIGGCSVVASGLNKAKSEAFVYGDTWYFKDGKGYYQYGKDKDGKWEFKEVEGYVPTTMISGKPKGGGKAHEDVNMLTPLRINTFLGDGEGTEFLLDTKEIDTSYKPIVKTLNDKGEWVTKTEGTYTVDYAEGKITFNKAPMKPFTDGKDNISVQFRKTVEKYKDVIQKCTLLQVFDNRVFFSGNPDYPNVLYHCSLNDPTYCSDMDYYNEGLDAAMVKGLVAGNNALWVFREPSQANTTVFYHTPTIDDEYGKIYPNTHSSVTTGCVGRAINFNDDIVFFSERGMEGINGDITTEQVLGHRSLMVDRKLTKEKNYENMVLAEWEGYLLVFIDNHVYLADSRAVYTNEDHIEYDWFYWELDINVVCATVYKGVLYVGSDKGIYTLTDTEKAVESYWVTPKDKFQYPQMQKTTNKRGCVVEAIGDITVYAKVEDSEFEEIGTYENVEDYFVCRIKRKKFKDLQLKFHSPKGFSLEAATLECWIGGYIKR